MYYEQTMNTENSSIEYPIPCIRDASSFPYYVYLVDTYIGTSWLAHEFLFKSL